MRAHRNDVYRARRSRGKAWPVILWILAGLIVLAVILFFAGQKYIVYDSDGSLHVVFPIMETAAPVTESGQPETVDTELVLEDPDYSGIVSDAGKGLTELHGQYLTADKITPDGLTRAASAVKAAGGNALVLQMKAPGGTLSWKSGVSDAAAYGVNGTAELADAIQTVKGQNIYLVAVVSTCVDTLMAERYAPPRCRPRPAASTPTAPAAGSTRTTRSSAPTSSASARSCTTWALTRSRSRTCSSRCPTRRSNMRPRAARPRARMRSSRWQSICART